MINVFNNVPAQVLSFMRYNERDKVFAVFNFSDRPQTVTFGESLHHGTYTDYFSGASVAFDGGTRLELERWAYRLFVG